MKVIMAPTHIEAHLPKRSTSGSAGFDLHALQDTPLQAGKRAKIRTGVSMAIPEGYCGVIKPRSGLAVKHGIDILAGLIDSDFRGEIQVCLQNHGKRYQVEKGSRIAQIIFLPCLTNMQIASDLEETERGDSGFGSTGYF